MQQGCAPGSYAPALSHYLVTQLRIAAAAKRSFLDLSAACYRLIRESLLEEQPDDAKLARILEGLCISPALVAHVTDFACQGCLLQNASPHLKRVLSAMFHGNFFVMAGVQSATLTEAGSRPGDAVSDVLFA